MSTINENANFISIPITPSDLGFNIINGTFVEFEPRISPNKMAKIFLERGDPIERIARHIYKHG